MLTLIPCATVAEHETESVIPHILYDFISPTAREKMLFDDVTPISDGVRNPKLPNVGAFGTIEFDRSNDIC